MKTYNRKFKHSLLVGLALAMASSIASGQSITSFPLNLNVPHGAYVGIFGGWGHSGNNDVTQNGTAFFVPPLAVHASGQTGGGIGMAGLNIGYLWPNNPGCVTPGVELEGYYLRTEQRGELDNSNERLPQHFFNDTFPMNTGVFLINGILTTNTGLCGNGVAPYIGVGVGAAYVSINGADSLQTRPPEPNVNHFNSKTHDNRWTFAAQGKAGLRFDMVCDLKLLVEYRLLYLSPKTYTFGATQYPNHVPTTNWNVNFSRMYDHMAVVGLEYAI